MKKLFLSLSLLVGVCVFSQTFYFEKVEKYRDDKLKSVKEKPSSIIFEEDVVKIQTYLGSFEYEIEDGDGIVYILKDNRNLIYELSLAENLCYLRRDKELLIFK